MYLQLHNHVLLEDVGQVNLKFILLEHLPQYFLRGFYLLIGISWISSLNWVMLALIKQQAMTNGS